MRTSVVAFLGLGALASSTGCASPVESAPSAQESPAPAATGARARGAGPPQEQERNARILGRASLQHGFVRDWLRDAPAPPVTPPEPGTMLASKRFGSDANDGVAGIAATAFSTVIVAGTMGGTGDIGCGSHVVEPGTTAAYVAEMTHEGTCTWATYFDGTDYVAATAVAVAPDGSVYVGGLFTATATLDAPRSSAGGVDGFVVKLSSTGVLGWASTFGGADDEYLYALTASSAEVTVGGAFYGTTSLSAASPMTWTSAGDADAFVATYAAGDSTLLAARTFGGPGWDAINSMTRDGDAHVVAAGTHAGDLDLGAGPVATAGGQDGFVVVYDASLTALAVRSFGGLGNDAVHGAALDAQGRIVLSGYFQSETLVGGAAPLVGSGQYTAFWAAYDSSLAVVTQAVLESDRTVIVEALAPRPGGGVILAGHFTGVAAPGPMQMTGDDTRAPFIASFAADGSMAWARQVASSVDASVLGVVATASGTVLGIGVCEADASLGTGSGYDGMFVTLAD